MRPLAIAFLFAVAAALPTKFPDEAGPLKTFSNAIPGEWFAANTENELISYTSQSSRAAVTHFWITGTEVSDDVIIRYFIDGEKTPSIEYTPSMASGVGFDDETAPWGDELAGKGAKTGAWFNNAVVPFSKSIRVTFTPPKDTVLWLIIRGSENYPVVLRDLTLPASARLKLFKWEGTAQPLEYLDLAKQSSGQGVIYQTTLAVKSANLDYLEGCYRVYTSKNMKYPGMLLSSGTEDFFSSAYYFDAGQYRLPESGLSHMNSTDGTFSAYRFLDRDPVAFHNGFSLVWRVGDTQDPATGLKCTLESGGNPVGSPQPSEVRAYTWVYIWDDHVRDSLDVVSIGTALSQGYMTPEEKTLFEHKVSSKAPQSALTHFWMTSSGQADDVWIRYYIDGETEPSISFLTSMATGVPSNSDESTPWGTTMIGHQAKTGAWMNNFLVPFQKSVRVTYSLAPGASGSACFYAIVRGMEGMPLKIGGMSLPSSARLRLHKIEKKPLQDFEFVPLVQLSKGSGLLFLTTMAVESGDLNFLEGCIHAYTSADMPWPGVLLSTGTEDFFDSAYYFDAGKFHAEVSGLTEMKVNNTHASWASYRFQNADPVTFRNGFTLQWRNGDKTDGQGIKCFIADGENGIPAGKQPRVSLTPSVLTSYTWTYEWDDNAVEDALPVTLFGTGVSNVPVTTQETEFFSHNVTGSHGVMTHLWVTGDGGQDDTVFRYYFDGETSASIEFTPAMAAGTGFPEQSGAWAAGAKMGKGANTGGWWFNFRMPFQKSVRVTYQAARAARLYAIVRGSENLPIVIGRSNLELPTHARLRLIKTQTSTAPLDYATLAHQPAGVSGFIYMTSIAAESTNLNFLEGCFRYYPTQNVTFPGILLSSGGEDFYDSAFYFDAGKYRFDVSGMTHLSTEEKAQVSAYRFQDSDPLYFTDGFSFVFRNGDAYTDNRAKCLVERGGKAVGEPGVSNITAYTWFYTY